MGRTLQELQAENKRLRNEAESRKELVKIWEERTKLAEQNKRLLKQLRRSPTGVGIRKTLGLTGRTFFKAGKSVGRGLVRYGKFLSEVERRNERKVRTIKKVSKSKRRKR